MQQFTAVALLALAAGITAPAFSQTVSNPTQQLAPTPAPSSSEPVAVFRITVVGRSTAAVNYRPRSGATMIDFEGTPLMPRAKGKAEIQGEKGNIKIDAKFDKLESATRFGPEYLTYVLWAITPEGRATNLGEVQVKSDDSELKVTTELQAFALIVTAEPYFAVTQPSDVVVMENIVRDGSDATKGRVETVQAKYELMKRGAYLMNQDVARLKVKPLEPGAPLDLAEARNAVELARLAGADRFAADTFQKATGLLAEAEKAREKKERGNTVMMPARQAVQTAEDARLIALQQQEAAFLASQKAQGQQRVADARQGEADALERARMEATRRREAERGKADADAARVAAERDRLDAERRNLDANRVKAEAERGKLDAERATAEAERGKLDAERATAEANAARVAAESATAAAEAQTQQARAAFAAQAKQAGDAAAQSEREKTELRDRLRQQLNVVLATRETARGLIVNLSDVLFATGSANLKPGAREKLARVSGILLAHPDLKIEIEGHTDNVGGEDYNQKLSERRANAVRTYVVQQGMTQSTVGTAGFGEGQPVATNGTAAGRQQNRRVELVVSGDAIGTAK